MILYKCMAYFILMCVIAVLTATNGRIAVFHASEALTVSFEALTVLTVTTQFTCVIRKDVRIRRCGSIVYV